MKDKTFSDWTTDDLILTFGLQQVSQCKELDNWLNGTAEIDENEQKILRNLRIKAEAYVDSWNEAELRDQMISPILSLVDYSPIQYFFNAFAERRIEAIVNKVVLKGKVDWLVAFGKSSPHIPYFFIHEYKPQTGANSEPKGQLLATMLAAQVLNKKGIKLPENFSPKITFDAKSPIYGCYIIGKNWSFVVLKDLQFCISPTYFLSKKQDLKDIIKILKVQKQMIISRFTS